MSVNEVVNTYMALRKSSSVADAASATIDRFAIPPKDLVDTFSFAYLDPSRNNKETEVILNHRNELLAHFSSQS